MDLHLNHFNKKKYLVHVVILAYVKLVKKSN